MLKHRFLVDDKVEILVSATTLHAALYRLGRIIENSSFDRKKVKIELKEAVKL